MDDKLLGNTDGDQSAVTYKFQRLREVLRKAIEKREFNGKLPGERSLAKQFNVNEKTLSKAITELAAEGLLERTPGLGTFVTGASPSTSHKRWLVLCDANDEGSTLVRCLKSCRADLEVLTEFTDLRPSFMNRFGAIVILSQQISQSQLFEFILRNYAVVLVGSEPDLYSTHAVVFDRQLAVLMAVRELVRLGHRKLAAVEPLKSDLIHRCVRNSVGQSTMGATVEACLPQNIQAMMRRGFTAYVCNSVSSAAEVRSQLEACGRVVPDQASIVAVAFSDDDPSVSGFFLDGEQTAKAISQLLDQKADRPAVAWLSARFIDHGTISVAAASK